jgi:hypothetical protein
MIFFNRGDGVQALNELTQATELNGQDGKDWAEDRAALVSLYRRFQEFRGRGMRDKECSGMQDRLLRWHGVELDGPSPFIEQLLTTS